MSDAKEHTRLIDKEMLPFLGSGLVLMVRELELRKEKEMKHKKEIIAVMTKVSEIVRDQVKRFNERITVNEEAYDIDILKNTVEISMSITSLTTKASVKLTETKKPCLSPFLEDLQSIMMLSDMFSLLGTMPDESKIQECVKRLSELMETEND